MNESFECDDLPMYYSFSGKSSPLIVIVTANQKSDKTSTMYSTKRNRTAITEDVPSLVGAFDNIPNLGSNQVVEITAWCSLLLYLALKKHADNDDSITPECVFFINV